LFFSMLALAATVRAFAACDEGNLATPEQDAGALDASVDAMRVEDGGASARDALADGARFDAGANISASATLINELSPGDEWIELVNAGASPEDLAGFRLADRDKSTGEPKLAEAVTFPSGTTLAPGAYLLVRGGGVGDAGRPCPDGGQSACFNAAFGISRKDGETIFLLQPDGGVSGKVVLPPSSVDAGASWARLPSGVADAGFVPAQPTPGAVNVP
jgi:hypothetical protein